MSTALTLHNIDDELYNAVRKYAAEAKTSLGAAFKTLARRALGLPTAEEQERIDAWENWKKRYCHFTDEEMRPLYEALEAQSQIDPELWK